MSDYWKKSIEDNGRLHLMQKHHELNIACAHQLAEILRDVDLTIDERSYKTTAGGDERKLRGIPAIGRGVAGAIAGTSPHVIR